MSKHCIIVLVLPLFLFAAGCGSGTNEVFANSTSSSATISDASLTGRLFLGAQLSGIPIEVRDTKGNSLARTRTGLGGTFMLPKVGLPANFRVVARLSNGDEFQTEVRDFQGEGRSVVVNVPTSLVSGLMSRGATKAEAEARVAQFFELPSIDSVEYGSDESGTSPFSHVRFFQSASTAGGWNVFRERMLTRLASNDPPEACRLTRQVAEGGFSGLDPLLVQKLERLLGSNRFQGALRQAAAASLDETLSLSAGRPTPRVSPRSVLARLMESIREVTTAETDQQLRITGWSHILDALTYNYGVTRMVEVNQDILLDQISLVNNSSPATNQGTLSSQIQTVIDLANRVANINGGGDSGGTPTPRNPKHGTYIENPGTPYNTPGDVAQLNQDLQTAAYAGQFSLVLIGCANAASDLLAGVNNANTQSGSVGTPDTGNFPFATQVVYDMAMGPYHYFAGAQQVAVSMVAEQSHVNSPFSFAFINQAVNIANTTANTLKTQRAQMPLSFPSSQVMVDLQGGLIWWMTPLGAADISSARTYARDFRLTLNNGSTWDGWRLPTDEELSLLQDRGRLSLLRGDAPAIDGRNDPPGYVGGTLRGLVGLGIDDEVIDVFSDDGNAWCDSWVQDNSGHWIQTTGYYQLNQDGTRFRPDSSTTNQYPFFIVRNIARPVVIEDPNFPTSSPYVYGPPAATDFSSLGHMTALSGAGLFNGKFGCSANLRITIGGDFSMGKIGVASDSRSFPQYSYDQTIESYPSGTNFPLQAPLNLANFLAFGTDSSELGVDVEGNPLHHTNAQFTNVSYNFSVRSSNPTGTSLTTSAQRTDQIPARQLTDISVAPRNRIYPTTGGKELYHCLAYFDDDTVSDVTSLATWKVDDASSGAPATHATFVLIDLIWGLVPEELTMSATFRGITDTFSARISN